MNNEEINQNFKDCLFVVLKKEGFYSNDPLDKGGETIFGISRKNFPDWEGWKIVDEYKSNNNLNNLKTDLNFIDLVEKFYKKNFWDVLQLDAIISISFNLAFKLFDASINCYWKTVGKWLQRGLNLLNFNNKLFQDLEVDGLIGKNTISALKTLTADDIDILIQIINGLQLNHYIQIAEKDTTQKRFIRGWIRWRIMKNFVINA